jgi:hypothetical protein
MKKRYPLTGTLLLTWSLSLVGASVPLEANAHQATPTSHQARQQLSVPAQVAPTPPAQVALAQSTSIPLSLDQGASVALPQTVPATLPHVPAALPAAEVEPGPNKRSLQRKQQRAYRKAKQHLHQASRELKTARDNYKWSGNHHRRAQRSLRRASLDYEKARQHLDELQQLL